MAISEQTHCTAQDIASNAVFTQKYFPKNRPVPYGDIVYSSELSQALRLAIKAFAPGVFRIGKTPSFPSNLTLTRVK